MEGHQFIKSLKLQNILSYGESGEIIDLEPLNVIIGINGAGKSNLIQILGLFNQLSQDLAQLIREGGCLKELLWKGKQKTHIAQIEAVINYPQSWIPLRYRLNFTTVAQRLELIDEAIENEHPNNEHEQDVFFFYRYQEGYPVLNTRIQDNQTSRRQLRREDLKPDQSVLSQRKDPDLYPELTYLSNEFHKIRLYREWNLGDNTSSRRPQQVDLPTDFLLEDCSNLGLVLNRLQNLIGTAKIIEKLQQFYEPLEEITTTFEGGTVQIFLREKGLNQPIPATRISDGTLRYLCLLVILLHPTPPPLICIEEPELGLHPDILPTIAELLIEASQKTQLIVTT
ncbi:MAG: AAA family ATPase, partial [Microcystaceae cyanobacterium]